MADGTAAQGGMSQQQVLMILVPVMTTLISVAGSFGTAWLTTGAKFKDELAAKGEQIQALQQAQQQSEQLLGEARAGLVALEQKLAELSERRQALSSSLTDMDSKLTVVDQRFLAIREQSSKLSQQLDVNELKLKSLKGSAMLKEQGLVKP